MTFGARPTPTGWTVVARPTPSDPWRERFVGLRRDAALDLARALNTAERAAGVTVLP